MEIEETKYLSYADAVFIHIHLMRICGEIHFGVFDRALIESALTRPQQSAAYENSDIIRQAATLCYGLIKNHPWVGGNKRTATAIVDEFLYRNGKNVGGSTAEIIELVLAVEADLWKVDEIEAWLRQHCI
ncbi:MAG TPA: type II toxin-antitoxin system death-on-curing family toxin [Blastocatellia bacterium]|nr:type II toxin-antitoxin system death-on-curing family toxin [Blastocatellia bacterium]